MYAILCHPGHNRVYFDASKSLAVSELTIASARMQAMISDIRQQSIAGIQYLVFEADDELGGADLMILGRLSFIFALFRFDGHVLLPIELPVPGFIGHGISSMLKYTGKTNEIFTRLLINVAAFSSAFPVTEHLKLLDPIAGKGTTLYEGLVLNYDVYGIEVGDKVVTEAYHFLRKYLESGKYKHIVKQDRISGPGKSFTAQRYHFEIARSKDEVKNKEFREFEIISGNSVNADKFYKRGSFHLIVGDLPYGVQHGSVTNEKQSSLTRNPKELLSSCLPAWKNVLKPGGVLALSWNTFVLGRTEMAGVLDAHGFSLMGGEAYNFAHRVDQAINRDIVVAKKD